MYTFYECNVCGYTTTDKDEKCSKCDIGNMIEMTIIRKDVLEKLNMEKLKNKNYLFISRIMKYSEDYEKITKDYPLREKTFQHFIHWVFNEISQEHIVKEE